MSAVGADAQGCSASVHTVLEMLSTALPGTNFCLVHDCMLHLRGNSCVCPESRVPQQDVGAYATLIHPDFGAVQLESKQDLLPGDSQRSQVWLFITCQGGKGKVECSVLVMLSQ